MFTIFFLAFWVGLQGQEPRVSVASQLQCGSERYAVLQVSNPSDHHSIQFPLSPLYTQGFTIHDVRLEVEEKGKWRTVGRGVDFPASGIRELKPGERFLDLFQLPTTERDATLEALPMRLIIPYRAGDSIARMITKEFRTSDLPFNSDLTCPATANAK